MITPIESILLSTVVYSKAKNVRLKFCEEIETVVDNGTDALCKIFKTDDAMILSFAGTESIRDFGVIFKINKERINLHGESFKVHKGFLQAYLSLHDQILEVLSKYPDIKKIHYTGHSMGGAMANIAFLFLHKGYKKNSIYTFGSPMFCNASTANYILQEVDRYKRFAISWDIISYLPSSIFGYRHVDATIKLDRINGSSGKKYVYNFLNNHKCLNYIKSVLIYVGEKEILRNLSNIGRNGL